MCKQLMKQKHIEQVKKPLKIQDTLIGMTIKNKMRLQVLNLSIYVQVQYFTLAFL